MSILIKGMAMPKDGCLHMTCIYADGTVSTVRREYTAVPVPPHGRLIDADEFLKRAIGTKCFRGDYALMLEELVGESTTVIPAEMIYVCVYRDSTDLYTEEECDEDNMTYLSFPEKIVREWFDKCGYDEFTEFNRWLYEEYTCDETDGLYNYALSRGFQAKRED